MNLKELRKIYCTSFYTIPHTKTFGELLTIAENLEAENKELRETLKTTRDICKKYFEDKKFKE